jgi:hypothetical protein
MLGFLRAELNSGRLTLTPEPLTPLAGRLRNAAHLVAVPLLLLALTPLMLLLAPVYAIWLRRLETTDPEVIPPPDPAHLQKLAAIEDHYTASQFSAMGNLKPGLFRRWSLMFFLWLVAWGARHLYHRGFLARVKTIHFARFVFLDGKRRLFFGSNYDGSLESYMDDFINKVAFGLNLLFSHGVGYPRTRWLILDGAKDEQKFKNYIRRHELATEVWYNGFPGLTAVDRKRNALIRQGWEKPPATEEEARAWLSMI